MASDKVTGAAFTQLAQVLAASQQPEFFDRLIITMASLLSVNHAFIARTDAHNQTARSIAFCLDGERQPNFSYSLIGAPCATIGPDKTCRYKRAVAARFPQDPMLTDLSVEGYFGCPILDESQRQLGILVFLTRQPLALPAYADDLVRVAAAVVAAELNRQWVEQESEETDRRLALLMKHLPGMAYQVRYDHQGTLEFASAGAASLTGYPMPELLQNRSVSMLDLVHPDDRDTVKQSVDDAVREGRPFDHSFRLLHADGRPHWVSEWGQALYGQDGSVLRLEGFLSDITDREQGHRVQQAVIQIAEAVTARSGKDFFLQLVRQLTEAVDGDAGFIATFGAGDDDADTTQMNMRAVVLDGRIRTNYSFPLEETLAAGVLAEGFVTIRSGAQSRLPSRSRLAKHGAEGFVGWRLDDSHGNPLGVICVMSRGTFDNPEMALSVLKIFGAGAAGELERQSSENRMRELAFKDPVTGVVNRVSFMRELNLCSQHFGASSQSGVGCIVLDVVRFKELNDIQGCAVGDWVLSEIGRRCQQFLDTSDTLARLNGDEFGLLVWNLDAAGLTRLVMKILHALRQPMQHEDRLIRIDVSAGVSHMPVDARSGDELYQHASLALQHARNNGVSYAGFDQQMADTLFREQILHERLVEAIRQEKLMIYFQPQIDLASGLLVGAEVLCRWQDAEWGWISPGEFIPLSEERGSIGELGDCVMRKSCQQLSAWRDQGVAFPGRLSVNVSAHQLEETDLANRVLSLCERLDPNTLSLELTESGLMRNPDQAIRTTRQLRDAGFELAIDDFGTGYSSLTYLRRFSADTLKIDMSFVRAMLVNEHDKAIVDTIIAMARALGMKTVAEGVETAEQADALLAMGCDQAQGYFYGRPVAAEEFQSRWLSAE